MAIWRNEMAAINIANSNNDQYEKPSAAKMAYVYNENKHNGWQPIVIAKRIVAKKMAI